MRVRIIVFLLAVNIFLTGFSTNQLGAEVLGMTLEDGLLTLNVSKGILNYGGSTFELELVEELMEFARNVYGAKQFTLLIEGELGILNKGLYIYNVKLNHYPSYTSYCLCRYPCNNISTLYH